MNFRQSILLARLERMVAEEADRMGYKGELSEIKKVLEEQIKKGRIKRFEDLRNAIHSEIERLSGGPVYE